MSAIATQAADPKSPQQLTEFENLPDEVRAQYNKRIQVLLEPFERNATGRWRERAEILSLLDVLKNDADCFIATHDRDQNRFSLEGYRACLEEIFLGFYNLLGQPAPSDK